MVSSTSLLTSQYQEANTLEAGTIGPIKKVADGLYTAKACSPTGEIYYLAMEKIQSQKEKINWGCYNMMIDNLSDCSVAPLPFIANNLSYPEKIQQIRSDKVFQDMSDEEFNGVVAKIEALVSKHTIRDQAGEMLVSQLCNIDKSDYVAYAAKEPIIERSFFGDDYETVGETYKTIQKLTDPIIMNVGVMLKEGCPFYENRGIYRNPFSTIERTYGRISSQLHAFTAKVITEADDPMMRGKSYMRVAPVPVMAELLTEKVGRKNVLIGEEIPKNIASDWFYIAGQDTPIAIRIEALSSLHSASHNERGRGLLFRLFGQLQRLRG